MKKSFFKILFFFILVCSVFTKTEAQQTVLDTLTLSWTSNFVIGSGNIYFSRNADQSGSFNFNGTPKVMPGWGTVLAGSYYGYLPSTSITIKETDSLVAEINTSSIYGDSARISWVIWGVNNIGYTDGINKDRLILGKGWQKVKFSLREAYLAGIGVVKIFGFNIEVLTSYSTASYAGTMRNFALKSQSSILILDFPALSTPIQKLDSSIPTEFQLLQNYPNPFNPTTNIRFDLPKESNVTLKVYNVLGQEVAKLIEKVMPAGHLSVNFDATKLSSGLYIYRLQAGDFVQAKKMLLLR